MELDELVELVEHWTLLDHDQALVAGKQGATRLGFALLLKHYSRHGRFAEGPDSFPGDVVDFVGRQIGVDAIELTAYDWVGRTAKRHRGEIRAALGYRRCSVGDADKLVRWLVDNVAQIERRPVQVREELLARCRAERIEPPTEGQVDRMVRSALHQAEEALCLQVTSRLGVGVAERIEALVDVDPAIADDGGSDGMTKLAFIRSEPGKVSLESMLTEIDKLATVRAVGLPGDLFADVAPRVVAGWHARVSVESPSHMATHPRLLRLTLLAAFLHTREHQLTDTLVDLLIRTVHNIGARAERRVTQELVNAFRRVTGKENILFSIAEAALDEPDAPVRDVVYPAVNGGEQTLRDLVHEYKTKGPEYRHTVRTTLRASYTGHYRRGLIRLLEVLEFRSNNTAHQPVIEALALIGRYASAGNLSYYPLGEQLPIHRGIAGDWADLVYRTDGRRRQRVVRMVYEICTFQALRDQLRCKEIWVVGADNWRNPDQDLPVDFDQRRHHHYAALNKPLDPTDFIDELREDMRRELAELNDAGPLPWLETSDRRAGAIKLTPLDAAPEPRNLRLLKREVQARWDNVPLIDMLKEAALRTGCLEVVTTAATRRDLDTGTLLERLILAIYAYGTNTGIRAVAAGDHGHSTEDVRYVRRRYLSTDTARAIAVALADATFAARHTSIWGTSSTAVASDSTHVGTFDQNLFTEWHARYGGRGVLIYWHVEEKSVVVHSQLISCTASEVAAMIEGVMRHGTEMSVEANYVDSHGQSEVGFGITRLLGFELLPRIKRVNRARLYRPAAGEPDAFPALTPALTRPIRWGVIAEQYDQMIRYATAIRTGTASTEAILRRFTKANATHPTYQAIVEVGRAQKTAFVARFLRDRNLQREINAGLNVMEAWNGAGDIIRYGRRGELASNSREEQELIVLCLRILQAALVYINTLMIQDVLADPAWAARLTPEDHRGLTPLFWTHVSPYGEINLRMTDRLAIGQSPGTTI